jgi:hypothetical protein
MVLIQIAARARTERSAETVPQCRDRSFGALGLQSTVCVQPPQPRKDESESPTSPIGEIETQFQRDDYVTRALPHQGSPFKSGACADCSGNPPDMCVNAVTNNPAHPPPINAASTHQKETIGLPLRA